ncbi:acyl-CoA thioesterase, RmlC-like jelly roll fold, HotDog domain protein [Artemisia annua]|uniref:Acyl-CoA thioesterase, RmlC-like jelly roll fold, HotDog domain protein n=1 Tax=Artemisia annua TaxID=35608 RepID=A0A2U1MHU6_ARTAN|nr:acyl-CoA thioesterase, RmlC-like jelly roll fold, HotDog domain protein [Artemisia annua]
MDAQPVIEFLGDVPVLQRLPSSTIRKIAQHVVIKHFNSGENVFQEGENEGDIYFISEGEVEVSRSFHADNQDCQVFQWKKFDHFTRSEFVGQEAIIALTKLTCLMLPKKYSHLMHPESIWSQDINLETIAPVEHILSLDPLDLNTFRGITLKGAPKSDKVYGGQFMGQALSAASKTVNFLKTLHSFHAHFLLGGDVNIPIIYQVDRLRDVPNFATRRVNAVQKERIVFFLIASFHREEEGFDHQEPTMPSVPDPETLMPKYGLEEGVKLPRNHPRRIEASTSTSVPWPTEIRPVDDTQSHSTHTKRSPSISYWLRAKGRLPDDQTLHRCVGAYFSDMLFIQISLNPHRREGIIPSSISLDHSMWFHRDFRADNWLLYVIDSPTAYNARGFSRGQMFNRKGELVLSAMQVGVVRPLKTPSSSTASKL